MKNLNKIVLAAGIGAAFSCAHASSTLIEDPTLSTARTPYNNQCNVTYGGSGIFKAALRNLCLQSLTTQNIVNLQLSSGAVRYSSVMPAPIPESIEKESYVISNCTSIAR